MFFLRCLANADIRMNVLSFLKIKNCLIGGYYEVGKADYKETDEKWKNYTWAATAPCAFAKLVK